jgi:adenylate cyclase
MTVSEGQGLLSREQLAAAAGFTGEEIDQIEEAGVIGPVDGGYRGVELMKLQLIRQVADTTGGLRRLLRAYADGDYTLAFLEACLPNGVQLANQTYAEALAELGVPLEEMQAVVRACGLPLPQADQLLRTDEAALLRQYALIRALPIPLDARLHALRVTSEAVRRAAEVQVDLFRIHVEEPLLEAHRDNMPEGQRLLTDIAGSAQPLVEQLTHWLHQRYLESETLKDFAMHMEEAVRGESRGVSRRGDPAVAFIDLVGFTVLSSEGDEQALAVAGRFEDELVDITREWGGRVVKTMGDGAMLLFDEGKSAVKACLELVTRLPDCGLPPARAGINRGPVVAQAGDYYGATVNLAARINDYARPHEVLVSEQVLPDGAHGIELEEIGDVTLKGVPQPVHLLKARASS